MAVSRVRFHKTSPERCKVGSFNMSKKSLDMLCEVPYSNLSFWFRHAQKCSDNGWLASSSSACNTYLFLVRNWCLSTPEDHLQCTLMTSCWWLCHPAAARTKEDRFLCYILAQLLKWCTTLLSQLKSCSSQRQNLLWYHTGPHPTIQARKKGTSLPKLKYRFINEYNIARNSLGAKRFLAIVLSLYSSSARRST